MMKPKPQIKGRIYRPPSLDMSAQAVARRKRIWIEGDQRRGFAYADTPANRDSPLPLLLPARVEYRPRFNSNDF